MSDIRNSRREICASFTLVGDGDHGKAIADIESRIATNVLGEFGADGEEVTASRCAGPTVSRDQFFVRSVPVGELERLEEMRAQIQSIAYDGTLLIGERQGHRQPLESTNQYVRALEAKVERICNIAEVAAPDDDWQPPTEDAGDIVAGGERMTGGIGSIPAALEPGGEEASHDELEEVYTVEVEGRDDGLYIFGDVGYRNAFATAVESEGGTTVRGVEPLNHEAGAKALIAAEVEAGRRFEIEAIVRVTGADVEAAYRVAEELVRLAADTEGRIGLDLLEGGQAMAR